MDNYTISNQEEYAKEIQGSTEHQDTPKVIFQVAYQPTARGGLRHFTAGNLRIVKFARDLLDAKRRNEVVGHGDWFAAHMQEIGDDDEEHITEEDWRRFMEDEHGIKEKDQGKDGREQLLVLGQSITSCPLCNAAI